MQILWVGSNVSARRVSAFPPIDWGLWIGFGKKGLSKYVFQLYFIPEPHW